ncbi:MAG: radical SAM protein, partial [Thermoplasmata archaeon]|nr:radical SAM protein [Thermoplasmata archaeon]
MAMVVKETALKLELPKKTGSLCPECKARITADIYEENGKVMIKKTCPEHGEFKDVYWSDVGLYLMSEKWAVDGMGVDNPAVPIEKGCPDDCGLCDLHMSGTSLANLDLTNRCNLRCPICFANANDAGVVYEPTFEEVTSMLQTLRNERPVPVTA